MVESEDGSAYANFMFLTVTRQKQTRKNSNQPKSNKIYENRKQGALACGSPGLKIEIELPSWPQHERSELKSAAQQLDEGPYFGIYHSQAIDLYGRGKEECSLRRE